MLKDGKTHGDLMAAQATATLVDGGTNTVTLGMTRKTMLIQSVVVKKVPTAATAVSVTIAPLWQALTVSGTFSGVSGSQTIALTKQSDGRTWILAGESGEHVLPPSSQPASVSVNITIGGATKTYTYSCSDQLEAGYKINIDGTYTEAVGVNLTGTITDGWAKGLSALSSTKAVRQRVSPIIHPTRASPLSRRQTSPPWATPIRDAMCWRYQRLTRPRQN